MWDTSALATALLPAYSSPVDDLLPDTSPPPSGPAYQVLARKYRPSTFEDMIGQEAMVRTLTNAFATGRIAHAFMLTGVRGIGKTTTARLLARALNYEAPTPDGHDGPSTDLTPPGVHCEAIINGNHMDVQELNAADHTQVDKMRALIESAQYRPATARYKIYIMDEVHMLSSSAFNALLKLLEEPPEHVKFVLATTELRKVPVTILSRCQRFDLRRVDRDVMQAHLAKIAMSESIGVSDDGMALIARAAEGSVRDGLSLLDQTLVQATDGETITAPQVRDMLGLADRSRVLDLFEAIVAGDAPRAMQGVREQYIDGAAPDILIRDLLEMCHEVSRAKVLGDDATFDAGNDASTRFKALGDALSQGQVTRLWQMLLKAHDTVREAPVPVTAAEMAVLGLAQASDMPAPEIAATIIAEMRSGNFSWPNASEKLAAAGVPVKGIPVKGAPILDESAPTATPTPAIPAPDPAPVMPTPVMPTPVKATLTFESLEDLVAALDDQSQPDLIFDIERFVRISTFKPGYVKYAREPATPPDLPARMIRTLRDLTGELWIVDDTAKEGAEPIGVRERREAEETDARIREHPAFDHPLLRDRADFIEVIDTAPISGLDVTSED